MRIVLFFVLIVLVWDVVDGKMKMWGSRKKRDNEESAAVPPPKPAARDSGAGQSRSSRRRFDAKAEIPAVDSAKFEEVFNTYISSFEQLLDSEDFDTIVSPDSIRNMMLQFPDAVNIPELNNLLSMPEFNDPDLLKATIRDGLAMAKQSGAEIFALLSDPEKMEELLGQLPYEVKKLIEGLTTGDFSALRDFVSTLPGLDASQRRLLISLLDGNTDVLAAELQKVVGDEGQVEAARLQFLEAPELAEAMGLPREVLEDPVRWAQAVSESAEALLGGAGASTGGRKGSSRGAGTMKGQAAVMKELLRSFAQQQRGMEVEGDGETVEVDEGAPFVKRRFASRAA